MSEIVSDEVLREKSIASRKARDRVAIIGSGNW